MEYMALKVADLREGEKRRSEALKKAIASDPKRGVMEKLPNRGIKHASDRK